MDGWMDRIKEEFAHRLHIHNSPNIDMTLVTFHRKDERPVIEANDEAKPLIWKENTVSNLHGVINMDFFFPQECIGTGVPSLRTDPQ